MGALDFPEFPLTADQTARLHDLGTALTADQALWVSGYFAGVSTARRNGDDDGGGSGGADTPAGGGGAIPSRSTPAAAGRAGQLRTLTVLYGSETANSAALARCLGEAAHAANLSPRVFDMAEYKPRRLADEQDLLIITSTHGEGEPPRPAADFFEFVEGRKAPRLQSLRYAVLALGDSTYERYCEAGKRLDRRLEELGATRLAPRIDCDVDYDQAAADWTRNVLARLVADKPGNGSERPVAAARPAPVHAVPAQPARAPDRHHPAFATVIDNLVLTGRGSSKETRHIELSLGDSRLTYRPGDALGIVPRNDPAAVGAVIEASALPAGAPVSLKAGEATLEAALEQAFEITVATPRFLKHWGELAGAPALSRLAEDAQAAERTAFLRGHHIVDIIRRFPVPGLAAEQLVAGLRPLQPRLYSIASSSAATPGEAHLTVATVRYELHGRPRMGVASGFLATRSEPDTRIQVYVQPNPLFRLPEDDRPIVMIGAGTGVAPYRAFLHEREARGTAGRSWLFFGERHFRTDFLYQAEWQDFLKNGVLTRMTVAFSRDADRKTYVQHRMREHARELHAWLEEGANVYVCGDAAHLAPDVHEALASIVSDRGGLDRDAAEEYLRTLQRDRRYQRDVY
ncbi:MAG: assimilatory sulfite reductase (NADPH) flavoprotein subunit [Lautropia sp.]